MFSFQDLFQGGVFCIKHGFCNPLHFFEAIAPSLSFCVPVQTLRQRTEMIHPCISAATFEAVPQWFLYIGYSLRRKQRPPESDHAGAKMFLKGKQPATLQYTALHRKRLLLPLGEQHLIRERAPYSSHRYVLVCIDEPAPKQGLVWTFIRR